MQQNRSNENLTPAQKINSVIEVEETRAVELEEA